MKKKLLSPALIFCLFITCMYGQNVGSFRNHPLQPKEYFKNTTELSGIAAKGNILYMVSEKCHKLICVDKGTFLKKTSFELECSPNAQLEAICLYKDHLYVADEENREILQYDLQGKKISSFKNTVLDSLYKYNEEDTNVKGIEGIALHDNLVYVLWETNLEKVRSEIHVFSIEDKGLKHVKRFYLKLKNAHWRYSDLCWDQDRLLLLHTSYYEGLPDSNKYIVKELAGVHDIKDKDLIEPKEVINITSEVTKATTLGYHSNLEGITVDEEKIYIVSDNAGECGDERPARKSPILLIGSRKASGTY